MFLPCGDALYDVFPDELTSAGERSFSARIGGSPLNVALGLARLGNQTGFLAANSTDPLGFQLKRFLDENKVDTTFLAPTPKPTTLAMVATDEAGVPDYRFYLSDTADVSLSESNLPVSRQWQALSIGSYSTVIDPVASTLKAFVSRCSTESIIAYDPNVRPSIEPRPQVWNAAVKEFGQYADIIKLSDEDARFLAPDKSPESFAESLLGLGPTWVILTIGPNGAKVFGKEVALHVPGQSVEVVDTVGAGDTFQAALLHALNQQKALNKAKLAEANMKTVCEFAIKAAAVTCTRKGADLPYLKDLQN